ncbi:MAG: acyl-CoA thioesterase [Planctomycetota bacterium]
MNLFFRLLHLLLFSRKRARAHPTDEVSTPFRVWPTDLDLNRHMNNGKYLSVMDLARVDLMLRSGLAAAIRKANMYPVVASQSIRYRRSLGLFTRFDVRTRVIGWDEKFIYLRQVFEVRGEKMATAVVKGIFLRRAGGRVPPGDVVALAGVADDAVALPGWVDEWVRSEDELWADEGH